MTKLYDRDYFDRWYRRGGGIGNTARLARKVALAVATAEYHLERPLRSVLALGCGEGAWRAPLPKPPPHPRSPASRPGPSPVSLPAPLPVPRICKCHGKDPPCGGPTS